nr:hypothetical protein [Rhodococcus sp. (in: high G+C Gram-positive bacteria)]
MSLGLSMNSRNAMDISFPRGTVEKIHPKLNLGERAEPDPVEDRCNKKTRTDEAGQVPVRWLKFLFELEAFAPPERRTRFEREYR